MKPAIRITNLSKRYHLNDSSNWGYRTLREALVSVSARTWRRVRAVGSISHNGHTSSPGAALGQSEIWALKDVSIDIPAGEVVGVIGRNGAGKSTLLKVLSKITEPTEGRVQLHGRVASLLEVGTGFHPELTGRENIYLNGAILGMSRREIAGKFDEIVAFAEIEQFLDTPVKRYSSGMYVRLAFAVAAHLHSEILLVDEVLAVGDVEFQKKCLAKIGNAARGGRTVLFVSHNMAAVQNLCQRVMLFSRGRMKFVGDCTEGLNEYLTLTNAACQESAPLEVYRVAGMLPVIQEVTFRNSAGQSVAHCTTGGMIQIEVRYDSPVPLRDPYFGILVENITGEPLFFLQSLLQHGAVASLPQKGVVQCRVPVLPLVPGSYVLTFGCGAACGQLDYLKCARYLHVEAANFYGTGRLPPATHGRFVVPASWEFDGVETITSQLPPMTDDNT
jgi:lipopolysaccharide transport system ATP-binding protein